MTFEMWMIPLLVTIVAYLWALLTPGYHFGDEQGIGIDFLPSLRGGIATIVSLAAWLVWALLR